MAYSMGKIGALLSSGLFFGSMALTGVFAVEKVGDVDSFTSNVVSNGNPNINIVVGSNAASKDVVAAANIAAKVGSLMFKEGSGELGNAKFSVKAYSESDSFNLFGSGVTDSLFAASVNDDYVSLITTALFDSSTDLDATQYTSLEEVSTLLEVTDTDPSNWFANSDDDVSAEFLFARIKPDGANWRVNSDEMAYMTLLFDENTGVPGGLKGTAPGRNIAFLGEEWVVMGMSADADRLTLGKEVYRGTLKEGESYFLNGFEIKLESVIKRGNEYRVTAKILKDGKVVREVSDTTPVNLMSSGVGIRFQKVYEDISQNSGYADVVIVNNVKGMDLGSEVIPNYELYAVLHNGGKLEYTDDFVKGQKRAGFALKYVGDDLKGLKDGKEIKIADYAKLAFDDENSNTKLNMFFKMDLEKDVSISKNQKARVLNTEIILNELKASAKQNVQLNAPVALLDTETSLKNTDKNLILVGGPVVNSLTDELVKKGLVVIDEKSPATLVSLKDAANGKDVLIVAGGNRDKTSEAANALIEMM
ncbi:S-layer protein [Methanococcus vannielii SB]|uniref:S-layer protein n=1 Tax=Methanococcus vannielii (strain ATCC 35089 / DSM 1224 / JCM 13029 / OCM 148 / SB) TaxID=406327 RepID=A6UN88_METVS|nr:S-layer protein [Methanococcus vannielii]ABR53960.1 S-layer protein [Methanococcus vannielii SB]